VGKGGFCTLVITECFVFQQLGDEIMLTAAKRKKEKIVSDP
jgi:hypothetical protein